MKCDLLVNKQNPLPTDYIPENLVDSNSRSIEAQRIRDGITKPNILVVSEALAWFRAMQKDALRMGYDIELDSAYRSYDYQAEVLDRLLLEEGEEAYKYCAIPGTSEHQTGLAIDLCIFRGTEYFDEEINESKPEIIWVHNNAHRYGFIVRYPLASTADPDDINEITGYKYEPWHLRFVGLELAKYLVDNDLTLEEYHEKKVIK